MVVDAKGNERLIPADRPDPDRRRGASRTAPTAARFRSYAEAMTDEQVFRVSIELDGIELVLLIPGASEDAVRAKLRADWKAEGFSTYTAERDGRTTEINLRWHTIATFTEPVITPASDDVGAQSAGTLTENFFEKVGG